GFVAIGLLYGEGDFRNSVLYAVNCGDDSDCTGATVASIMGIIGGTAGIPEEWKEFVGDNIVTAFINSMYGHRIPKTCTNLKDRVAALVPEVMRANRISFGFIDGADEVSEADFEAYNQITSADFFNRSPYSYEITDNHPFSVLVELDKTPRVTPGEERKVKLTFTCRNTVHESRKLQLRVIVPEGWEAGYCQKTLALDYAQPGHKIYGVASTEFTIRAGENIDVTNRAYVEITCPTLPYAVMIPVIFIG
ncbi:MAG: ADP-ribosylglycohydrolase family protein, partial [Clostridia bacterium]|nr:ADP-ribosylglycohydrolase family protein [Clostridia bacterium]